jgi:hypothetical protein
VFHPKYSGSGFAVGSLSGSPHFVEQNSRYKVAPKRKPQPKPKPHFFLVFSYQNLLTISIGYCAASSTIKIEKSIVKLALTIIIISNIMFSFLLYIIAIPLTRLVTPTPKTLEKTE